MNPSWVGGLGKTALRVLASHWLPSTGHKVHLTKTTSKRLLLLWKGYAWGMCWKNRRHMQDCWREGGVRGLQNQMRQGQFTASLWSRGTLKSILIQGADPLNTPLTRCVQLTSGMVVESCCSSEVAFARLLLQNKPCSTPPPQIRWALFADVCLSRHTINWLLKHIHFSTSYYHTSWGNFYPVLPPAEETKGNSMIAPQGNGSSKFMGPSQTKAFWLLVGWHLVTGVYSHSLWSTASLSLVSVTANWSWEH
jgi:hypothetical protein